jgi:hypothetical protein
VTTPWYRVYTYRRSSRVESRVRSRCRSWHPSGRSHVGWCSTGWLACLSLGGEWRSGFNLSACVTRVTGCALIYTETSHCFRANTSPILLVLLCGPGAEPGSLGRVRRAGERSEHPRPSRPWIEFRRDWICSGGHLANEDTCQTGGQCHVFMQCDEIFLEGLMVGGVGGHGGSWHLWKSGITSRAKDSKPVHPSRSPHAVVG